MAVPSAGAVGASGVFDWVPLAGRLMVGLGFGVVVTLGIVLMSGVFRCLASGYRGD
jgi:hypothetical protein